jgi:7-cyano-7-deazaguanine reductase
MPDKQSKTVQNSPLGKTVDYSGNYQPSLIFPIARQEKRDELGLSGDLPFTGEDIWNAYEISWLNAKGLPQVAIAEFRFLSSSVNIVESKSLKLYLNSLNQTIFDDMSSVQAIVAKDLSEAAGCDVGVVLKAVDSNVDHSIQSFSADCLDSIDVEVAYYDYDVSLLEMESNHLESNHVVCESLCSHLLKSNCLITNQPDWASVLIQYKGAKICHASLLKYLVSFRTHNEFHEQCVERIFTDLLKYCQPEELTIYARYTRRGGLDINPWRSNCLSTMENIRLSRQ